MYFIVFSCSIKTIRNTIYSNLLHSVYIQPKGKSLYPLTRQEGFTLIEIIVGIVALGLSFTILTILIFPQAQRSTEPVLQARASALGQALIEEIISKHFDSQNILAPGNLRCGEQEAPRCTDPIDFGAAGPNRADYRSVEDYHGLELREDALGTDLSEAYRGFSAFVTICYSDDLGNCHATTAYPSLSTDLYKYKRISVSVVTPTGQPFVFSTVRGNY